MSETIVPPHIQDAMAKQAFINALGEIQQVTKTKTADAGRYEYTYADLGDVMDECKRACDLHDLVFTQTPTVIDGYLAVNLEFLHHSGGSYVREPLMMQLPKEAQAYGSALTYARRYQLMTVFRIAPEDDDGKTATVAEQTQPGRRTEAERLVREAMVDMTPQERAKYVDDFKIRFGMGLSSLSASRHGEALTWTREWATKNPPSAEDEADATWIADAKGVDGAANDQDAGAPKS